MSKEMPDPNSPLFLNQELIKDRRNRFSLLNIPLWQLHRDEAYQLEEAFDASQQLKLEDKYLDLVFHSNLKKVVGEVEIIEIRNHPDFEDRKMIIANIYEMTDDTVEKIQEQKMGMVGISKVDGVLRQIYFGPC